MTLRTELSRPYWLKDSKPQVMFCGIVSKFRLNEWQTYSKKYPWIFVLNEDVYRVEEA